MSPEEKIKALSSLEDAQAVLMKLSDNGVDVATAIDQSVDSTNTAGWWIELCNDTINPMIAKGAKVAEVSAAVTKSAESRLSESK